jgi:hypothetical protein
MLFVSVPWEFSMLIIIPPLFYLRLLKHAAALIMQHRITFSGFVSDPAECSTRYFWRQRR